MQVLAATTAGSGSGAGVLAIIYLAVLVFEIAALWKLFKKAHRPGWAAIIPIYNTYVMLKIAGRSGWWILLFCIPLVNLVFIAIALYDLARSFGKGGGFAVGLFFLSPIFVPILGYGSATYFGPAGAARFSG